MYTSVAFGNHSVRVRGTTQDGQTSELLLTPLQVTSSQFMVTASAGLSGTIITLIIETTQDATFRCQLDDLDFVPCKQSTSNYFYIQAATLYLGVLLIFAQAYQGFSTQECPVDHILLEWKEPILQLDK